jgi:hypothetical protein
VVYCVINNHLELLCDAEHTAIVQGMHQPVGPTHNLKEAYGGQLVYNTHPLPNKLSSREKNLNNQNLGDFQGENHPNHPLRE